MKTMETELKRLDSELYAMYLRSLEIAELKWLPNIKPKNDSYNSYPHIKGVMSQIDRLLYDNDGNSFSLNCSELYILLCAILMHDIGKGASEKSGGADNVPDHALDSYKIIVTHWAVLGLPTKKVAEIIADICRSHDRPDGGEMEELYTKYYIDQFDRVEPIRGRLLGALLFLGDHMDNKFTRTVPLIFKESERLEVVGNFRSKIADVRFDRQNKMIREILDKNCFSKEDVYGIKTLRGDLFEYLSQDFNKKYIGQIPKVSALYTIADDAMKNERQIALIKDELNIMGISVKKWLIECDEHLFQISKKKDQEGNVIIDSSYALEPIINLDYCLEVLKGICTLSGGIFARQFFQYSELVNFIREEERKVYKVKCAVRRLSLLLETEKDCGYIIYYDENNWSFCRKNVESGTKKRKQEDMAHNRQNSMDEKDSVYKMLGDLIRERLEK